MAYNLKLADRVKEALAGKRKVEEKKMMGGLTFMVNNKMCVGISGDDLMARKDPEIYVSALKRKGCREMDFTGRPMRGFVFVNPDGIKTKKDLEYWLNLALEYNKKAKAAPKRKSK